MMKVGVLLVLAVVLLLSGCSSAPYNYSVVSQNSGKCLSLNVFGGYYDGDPVEQWNCAHYHMGLQASWVFEPAAQTNQYRIVSIHSGKCLEVSLSSGGKNNGDIVQQAKCTGADNQLWTVITQQGGTTITSLLSGKCLEVKLGSTGGKQDGDAVDQWDCSGALNQAWTLKEIEAPSPPLDTEKGALCNVCNPGNPECAPGAKCMVTASGQSICGQSCSTAVVCPSGYTCTPLTSLGITTYQCIPVNNQCPH